MMDINQIIERMRLAGEEWAESDRAANLLEETKHSILSQIKLSSEGLSSEAAKETFARASDAYMDHVKAMTDARGKANMAKVKWVVAQSYVDLIRTMESSRRAELQR